MKTLKYRSAFVGIMAATLSVFLFTACEKESDSEPAQERSRIEKFSRLSFTTESSSGSGGSYTGNNGSVTYTQPGASNSSFSGAEGSQPSFTDPRSRGNSFAVSSPFSFGGGSVNIDGTDFPLSIAICANEDLFDIFEFEEGEENEGPEFDLFIGVAGDFEFGPDQEELPLDLLVYAISYNGGSQLGSYESFENDDEIGEAAFVIVVEYSGNEGEPNFWFGTDGAVSFSGPDVLLAGVELSKVDLESAMGGLTRETVSMTGDLSCVEAPEEAL